jgi:hypothetical protein
VEMNERYGAVSLFVQSTHTLLHDLLDRRIFMNSSLTIGNPNAVID